MVRRGLWRLTREFFESGGEVATNLGMTGRLRVQLPASAGQMLLFGRPKDYIAERGALGLCQIFARKGRPFVDVGAHYGLFTFQIGTLERPPARQFFLEPNPELFARLGRNCLINGLEGVRGHQVALGRECGRSRFFLNLTDDAQSSLFRTGLGGVPVCEVGVDVWTWERFCLEEGITDAVVKVDVENDEYEVLEGIGRGGASIAYLVMEVLKGARERGFLADAEAHLGMNAYYINDFRLERWRTRGYRYASPHLNWLFCREDSAGLHGLLEGTSFRVVE